MISAIEYKFLKEEIQKPIKKYSDLSSSQKNVLFGFMKYYDKRNNYLYNENKLLKEDKRKAREEEEAINSIPFDKREKDEWWKTFNEKWKEQENKIKKDRVEEYYVQFINKQ